ncbi:hypothetical protein C8R42DRAFT_725223 [Lentinula raphanica]|nr:hypothetical protein C8R42DRAFT_725223 [Lentinula raphanica]
MFINSFNFSTRLLLPVLLSTLLIMMRLSVVTGIPLPAVNNGKAKIAAHLDHDRYDTYGPSSETEHDDGSTTAYGPSSETEQDDVYLLPIINEENDTYAPPTTEHKQNDGQTPAQPPSHHTKGAVFSKDRLFILRIQEKAEGVEGPVLYYSDTQGLRPCINENSEWKWPVNWPWVIEDVTSPRETVLQLKIVAVFGIRAGKNVEEGREALINQLKLTMFQAEHHFVQAAIQKLLTYNQKRFQLLYLDRKWEKELESLVMKDRFRWRDGEYKKLLKKYVEDAERKVKAQELNDPEEDEIWWKLEKLIWNNCMQGHGMRPNIAGLARKGRECLSLPIRVRIQRW